MISNANAHPSLPDLNPGTIVSEEAVESVLLVDGDEGRRKRLSEVLRGRSFHVVEAGDGGAALHLLRDMKGSLEWLVTNVQLGILSGLHVAFQYRFLHPARPIVFIEDSDTPDEQDLLNGSVTLRQPFAADQLVSLMERLRDTRHEVRTLGC